MALGSQSNIWWVQHQSHAEDAQTNLLPSFTNKFRLPRLDHLPDLVIYVGEPEGHVGAGRGHHHVLRVEQHALDRALVISVQHADLLAVLRIPDVDPTVCRAADDELRVWGEGGLQGEVLGVEVASERLQCRAVVAIDEFDHGLVRRDEDGLAIWRKLQSGPLDLFTVGL